jgi:uncharacterized repeat protein (TIGR03803 family)
MPRKRLFFGFRSGFSAVLSICLSISIFQALVRATPVAAQEQQQQEKVLYNFFNVGDAVNPVAGVISDAAGNLYGTSFYGGAYGNGMVYLLTPGAGGWQQIILHSFNPNGIDGFGPTASLIFDSAGNLYGTTEFGGTGACTNGFGCGTAFELSPANGGWTETILHDFQGTDGWEVHAGLVMDSVGNLYGTTANGGASSQGVVFELSPRDGGTWTETTVHNFTGGADGGVPWGSVILDAAGNVYGMTSEGGGTSAECKYGCGVVFELSPVAGGRWTGKLLHNFSTLTGDGRYPSAALTFDSAGNLYGTAGSGGGNGHFSAGIVFKLSPIGGGKWQEKILHNFNQTGTDGVNPSGTLVFDAAGNLYGVTQSGGSGGHGTAFELTPSGAGSWSETILHNFSDNGADGYFPSSALIFDASGNLYGTTPGGGHFGLGTVFEIMR